MNKNSLIKLEFNKVLDILKTFAITEKGKNKILELEPFTENSDVQRAQNETTESLLLLFRKG